MTLGARIASLLLVCAVALVQSALAWRLAIGGAAPNVLFVVVASVALLTGPVNGALAGFVAGVSFALFSIVPLGTHALVGALVGYAIGRVGEQLVTDDHPAPPILAAVFACAAMALGRPVVEFLVNPASDDSQGVWRIAVISTALGAMLAIPVYLGVRRLLGWARSASSPASDEVVA